MNLSNCLDFSGKVVLITGSSRGIGFCTAELFAAHGAKIIVNGLHDERVALATAKLKEKGHAVRGICADVSHPTAVRNMINDIVSTFGRIDVLINNAGVIRRDTVIESHSDEDWKAIMEVNLYSAFYTAREVIPHMKQRRNGAIVNFGSQTAVYGSHCAIAYPSSKGGIMSFTRTLANEIGGYNIRVNAVAPGLIKTDMTKWTEVRTEEYEKINAATPLRRMGQPDEVASVCLFLASDLASYITGQVIAINGGRPSLLFL